jgi:nucleoside phosphorylase
MIPPFLSFHNALSQLNLEPTAEELAEVLWLARHILKYSTNQDKVISPVATQSPLETSARIEDHSPVSPTFPAGPPELPIFEDKKSPSQKTFSHYHQFSTNTKFLVGSSSEDGYLYARTDRKTASESMSGYPFRTPATMMLPHSLSIGRALRPLMQRVTSQKKYLIDENATVERIADSKIWSPLLRGAPERWLELALVVEQSPSMQIWQPVIAELRRLLEHHGAFRDVRTWELHSDQDQFHLYPGPKRPDSRPCQPRELLDPMRRRLIVVVSDGVSPIWRSGQIVKLLEAWGLHHLTTLLQMLPQRLWPRTGLGKAREMSVRAMAGNVANIYLCSDEEKAQTGLKVPVITLEPDLLAAWANLVVGKSESWVPGVVFKEMKLSVQSTPTAATISLSTKQRIQRFYATASPLAQRLAGYLSAAPLTLPVMRLVQQVMLRESSQVHLAEVFLGGLLKRVSSQESHPYLMEYDFHEGVREFLLEMVLATEAEEVWEKVSNFLEERIGQSLDFQAVLAEPKGLPERVVVDVKSRPFARVAAKVLRRLGGKYADLAQIIESQTELSKQAEHAEHKDKPEDVIRSNANKIDFAIITALQIELEAVLSKLGTYKIIANESERLTFYLGNVGNAKVIVTCMDKMGNVNAALTATIVLERFHPGTVLMVGIAAGFEGKVKLGDVVVAESCYYDGSDKETADGKLSAPRQIPTSPLWLSRSKNYWYVNRKISIQVSSPASGFQPDVHHGVIVSSEMVVGSPGRMAKLLKAHRECRALAMEGYGVAEATWLRRVDFLEIRGICDFGDASKNDNWHKYAADVAAAYAVGLLRYTEDIKTREPISSNPYRPGEALAGHAYQVTDFQPYETGAGLSDDRTFVGRGDLLAWLLNRWRQPDSKPTIVLIGQRRIGKTSLLHKIQRAGIEHTSLIPLFIDVQGVSSEYDFLTTARDKMATALSLSPPSLDRQEPYVDFKQFLAKLKTPLAGRRFLLMLDEAEKIPAGRLGDRLPDFLRSLMQGHEYPMVLLFGGTQALQRTAWNYSSILFNTAQFKTVSYLSKEESQELLQKPAKDILEFDPQVLDAAYDWTRGQPLLLQSIGAIVIDQFNQTVRTGQPRSSYVNYHDFEQAVETLVKTQNNAVFVEHWRNNDAATHRVLATLAWCLDDTYPQIDFEGLLRKMKDARLELPQRKDVSDIVQRLVEEEILEQAGLTYRFCVPLYRRWIAWRWDIRRVREEGI